jgi:hypothetical protein
MRSTCWGSSSFASGFELLGRIEDEHFFLSVLLLALAKDENTGGEASAVEKIWPETDDRFEQIHLKNLLPNCSFLAHTKERAVRQHYCHATGSGRHRLNHVLHPGVVAAFARRHTRKVPAVGIAGPDFVTPFLQREGRIGDDAVKCGEVVTREKCRVAKCITTDYLKICSAVQKKIHPCDSGRGQILFLSK